MTGVRISAFFCHSCGRVQAEHPAVEWVFPVGVEPDPLCRCQHCGAESRESDRAFDYTFAEYQWWDEARA